MSTSSTRATVDGRFGLFADVLLLGVFTAVASVGVITAFPAFAAACALLRERVAGGPGVGVRPYLVRLAQALRAGPAGLLIPPAVAAVLAVDALAIAAGAPGRPVLATALAVALLAAVLLGLRAAGGWRPGLRWGAVLRGAARQVGRRDLGGDALLLVAVGTAVAVVTLLPITALLLAGPLAAATVAVDARSVSAVRAGWRRRPPC
ncbi:hypothetical protein ACFV1F_02870 [Streptomyces sp. NPDC059590]|uniref:hypothetical protein n=1 Tax=unclassified Streptomyces TaxID=2593676 RepID=UPI00368C7311